MAPLSVSRMYAVASSGRMPNSTAPSVAARIYRRAYAIPHEHSAVAAGKSLSSITAASPRVLKSVQVFSAVSDAALLWQMNVIEQRLRMPVLGIIRIMEALSVHGFIIDSISSIEMVAASDATVVLEKSI